MTGFVVKAAGFDAGFLMLAAIAGLALLFYAFAMPETRAAERSRLTTVADELDNHRSHSLRRPNSLRRRWPMSEGPITVVIPGDLHLTEPDLENHRVAHWVVDEVNGLIRPDFVQFIGDNVQDATERTVPTLQRDSRPACKSRTSRLVGDHDVKDDPTGDRVPPAHRCDIRIDVAARVSLHPAQHARVAARGALGRADRLVSRRDRLRHWPQASES